MQLADNPITKIILEKLKHKDFRNLNHLIFDEKRSSEFQYELQDLKIDITRQSLDKEIKEDLIDLAKETKIKTKISGLMSGAKINLSEKLLIDKVEVTAEGPGSGYTLILFLIHSLISIPPGSDIQGVPASDIIEIIF